jgi:ATP-dependent exoDNAse (exonuclease V) alpha subunit
MNPDLHPSAGEVLAGLVERVTYHNDENGFCVLRTKARGHRDLITVVGHAAAIAAGEWITATGEWVNDRTHGRQFRARFLRSSAPTSVDGIEKYLASGMIRGIGPVYGKKLVRAFGEKVFDVVEAAPDRLREVESWSCKNAAPKGLIIGGRAVARSHRTRLRASGGPSLGLAAYVCIAAISRPVPMMFMTRVRL